MSSMDQSTQRILLIINDGPYGNERPFNALRLALNLVNRPAAAVRVFLTGDGVACARRLVQLRAHGEIAGPTRSGGRLKGY
jgi:sulfur relay (sulfurtransferase) complex TusBCD TusD component (DsrE family)